MTAKHRVFLSKTKYLEGLKCPKLLWYEFNRKEEIPPPDAEAQEIMKQGLIVGELARELFPKGIKIEREKAPLETAKKSLMELKKRKPLFEAGFTHKNAYSLADILNPAGKDAWDLIEVKSSASVKDEHLPDAAFQKYVYQGNGIKIRKCYLMLIDKEYVRRGDIELNKLFKKEDITAETDKLIPGIEKEKRSMLKIIMGKEPDIKAGKQCDDCPLEDICWSFLPEDHIFILHYGNKVAFDLMERGILKMRDIPKDYQLNEKHAIQVKCHNSKTAHVDKKAVKSFIAGLQYPLYFLDFETIAPAIPVYDLSRPYEDIPFQFSLHVLKNEGAKPAHHPYLAPGDVDPRPEVLKRLKELLKTSGSIVAYNAGYERKCLKYAVRAYPKYAKWFEQIEMRIVDLLVPFRQFFYYHPAQEGKASMKNVLPALTGITYDGMEIGGGGKARFEYMRVTFEKEVDEKDRQQVRAALEEYCNLDTMGMIEILEALKEESK